MNVKETLEALADRLQATGVKTVCGDPIVAEGRTIVPAGVIEITPEQTRFLRFDDWRPLAAAAAIGFGLGVALSKWAARRPVPR